MFIHCTKVIIQRCSKLLLKLSFDQLILYHIQDSLFNPLTTMWIIHAMQCLNIDFKLIKKGEKISFEYHAYESVDDGILS